MRALDGAGVSSIASGGGSNYAVLANGRVMAWGRDSAGQLAVAWPEECLQRLACEPSAKKPGEEPEKKEAQHKCFTEVGWELRGKVPEPVIEAGGLEVEHIVRVSAGFEAAYAVLEDGEVLSWGNDGNDQLGQAREPGPLSGFTTPDG